MDCTSRSNEMPKPWIIPITTPMPLACSECDIFITEPSASTPCKSFKSNNDHSSSLIENMTPIQPVYHSAIESNIPSNNSALGNQLFNLGPASPTHTNDSHTYGPLTEATSITEENSSPNITKPSTVSKQQSYPPYCSFLICTDDITIDTNPRITLV